MKVFLGVESNRVENIPSKKLLEDVWLFRTLLEMYVLKIIICTPLEIFFEAFRFITKVS